MVVLKANRVNKLVTLIEDNPLVKDFSDVETVLTHLYGAENICLLSSETNSPKIQIVDLDTEPNNDKMIVRTYRINMESESFCIHVENTICRGISKFVLHFIYEEKTQTYIAVSL